MRILIFSLIFLMVSLVFGVEIFPEDTHIFDGLPLRAVVVSPSSAREMVLPHIEALRSENIFYTTNLLRDLGRILEGGMVQDLAVQMSQEKDFVDLFLTVTLNPVIRYLEIDGMTLFEPLVVKRLLQNQVGRSMNTARITQDIHAIEEMYHQEGYILARVTNVVFIRSLNGLIFSVEEGHIHEVRFNGLDHIHPSIILRELLSKPGSVFNTKRFSLARDKIFRLGYFSSVDLPRVVPSDEAPGQVDVVIDVVERKINNFQIGLEQLQNSKLSVALVVKLPNFRNTGEGLYLKGQSLLDPWFKDNSYYLKYTDLWFLNQPLPFSAIFWQQVNQENFNNLTNNISVRRSGWETNWELSLLDNLKSIFAFHHENVEDANGQYAPYTKNSVKAMALRNTVKDLNNPLGGTKIYVELERGGNFLGLLALGGLDYAKYSLDYALFHNVYKKDVLAVHVNLGTLQYSSGQQLFEQDKFTVGGAYSLRGYAESYVSNTSATVGSKKLLLNAEYRILLNEWLQAVLFIDGGIATDRDFQLGSLKWGKGMGVRIFTPIAPLRFDFALGDSNEFFLHFALGQLF